MGDRFDYAISSTSIWKRSKARQDHCCDDHTPRRCGSALGSPFTIQELPASRRSNEARIRPNSAASQLPQPWRPGLDSDCKFLPVRSVGHLLRLGPSSCAPVRPRLPSGTAAYRGLRPGPDRLGRVRNRCGLRLSAGHWRSESHHLPRPAPCHSGGTAHFRLSDSCQPRVRVALLGRSHHAAMGRLLALDAALGGGRPDRGPRIRHGPLAAHRINRVGGLVSGYCGPLSGCYQWISPSSVWLATVVSDMRIPLPSKMMSRFALSKLRPTTDSTCAQLTSTMRYRPSNGLNASRLDKDCIPIWAPKSL